MELLEWVATSYVICWCYISAGPTGIQHHHITMLQCRVVINYHRVPLGFDNMM